MFKAYMENEINLIQLVVCLIVCDNEFMWLNIDSTN